MPQFVRACALVFTVLIAQIWHLVPAHAAAETHVPTAPILPVADDPQALQTDELTTRLDEAAAKRASAERPVVLPVTGGYTRPLSQPQPVHYSGTIQQIIQQAFAPLGQTAVTWAERVAMCESGDNPTAVNRSSGAEGLFQIMPGTWAGTPYASQSPFDPVANAKAAAWIYARRGGSAWSCS
jgi:transglycosylase-like protein with SLT domain